MFSFGANERVWPFDDGLWVGSAPDRDGAVRLMERSGQLYDDRLQRYVARAPGAMFPAVSESEHRHAAAAVARVLSTV